MCRDAKIFGGKITWLMERVLGSQRASEGECVT